MHQCPKTIHLAGTALVAAALLTGTSLAAEPPPPVVPLPATMAMGTGHATITPSANILYADPSIVGAAQLLSDDMNKVFGLAPSVASGTSTNPSDILLQLITDPALDREGYRMTVTDHVVIEATGIDGLFAGAITLLQSMTPGGADVTIPRLTIEDEPFRSFRAHMIDVKGRWQPVADIERFIDICRFYKVRYLSLHTGESQWIGSVMTSTAGIPASTRESQRLYTQGEMDDLIAYGKARGVYLFPHNETTEGFAGMKEALQTDYNTSDAYPNFVQEAYADEGINFSPGNPEGLDGFVDTDGNGVDDADPDYWKAIEIFTKRSYDQFAAGYAGDILPYYHMGPVHGEGGTHPDNAVKVLDILREVDANVKLLFWNGPSASTAYELNSRKDETIVCFYSKSSSSSDVFAYLANDWTILNSAWSPLYIVGESVARTQQQVHDDWNTFRAGTDGFTGSGFVYDGIDWDEFDTPAARDLLTGGMLCTWGPPAWVHLDRVRIRLPAFSEHAWHHRPWPYPAGDYDDFQTRYLAVDDLVQAFLGLTPTVPTAPKAVKASNGTVANAIDIGWEGSAGFPDGYRVLRNSLDSLGGATQVSGDLFEESFRDTNIVVNTPYYYWVKAFNEVGESSAGGSALGAAGDGIARTEFYDPFEYTMGSGIDGKNGGTGWDGAWALTVSNPGILEMVGTSLTYSTLPVRGGAVRVHPQSESSGFEFDRDMAEAVGAGDTTLWLSFLVRGDPVRVGHVFLNLNQVSGGQVGKKWGSQFAFDNHASSIDMLSGQTYFVVVRYDFNAGADDLYMWINPSLSSEPSIATADHSTSGVDVGSGVNLEIQVRGYGQGDYLFDELRMGDSWAYATGGGSGSDTNDFTSPVPDPTQWNVPPQAQGATAINMLAATATDSNGVEYLFEELSGNPGGSDSTWQASPAYTDTGLDPDTEYTYRVKARDLSANYNETDWTQLLSATTDAASTNLDLLYYESFDYEADSLVTDAAGWSPTGEGSQGTVVEPDIGYTDSGGAPLVTSGRGAKLSPTTTWDGIRHDLAAPITRSVGEELWVCYTRRFNGSNRAGLQLHLYNGGTDAVWFGKYGSQNYNTLNAADTTNGRQDFGGGSIPVGTGQLLVLKIDYTGSRQNVYLWVDPLLAAEPDVAAADASVLDIARDASSISALVVRSIDAGGEASIDELRMADRWWKAFGLSGSGDPYLDWSEAMGLDAGNNGMAQNPDLDELDNLLEFVTDSNPLSSTNNNLLAYDLTPGTPHVAFKRNDDAEDPDLLIFVEHSEDLVDWTNVAVVGDAYLLAENGGDADDMSVPMPTPTEDRQFARLAATRL